MKRFVLLIASAIVCTSTIAQERLGYFYFEDGEIAWQKVYETKFSIKEIQEEFARIPEFVRTVERDSVIVGTITATPHEKYRDGKFIASNAVVAPYKFHAVIDIKDGRYRVTLTKFSILVSETHGGIVFNLSHFICDKINGKTFSKKEKKIELSKKIGQFLSDIFTIKERSGGNDW